MIVKAAHRRPEGPFCRLKSESLTVWRRHCHFERSREITQHHAASLQCPDSIERNVGSFLRKELPDRAEDRSEKIGTELTLLSSVA